MEINSPVKVQAGPENVGGIETRALVSERGQVVARGQVSVSSDRTNLRNHEGFCVALGDVFRRHEILNYEAFQITRAF